MQLKRPALHELPFVDYLKACKNSYLQGSLKMAETLKNALAEFETDWAAATNPHRQVFALRLLVLALVNDRLSSNEDDRNTAPSPTVPSGNVGGAGGGELGDVFIQYTTPPTQGSVTVTAVDATQAILTNAEKREYVTETDRLTRRNRELFLEIERLKRVLTNVKSMCDGGLP